MKKLALLLVTAVVMATAATTTAGAAPVKECGTVPSQGASLYNVTTRNVTCRRAKSFIASFPHSCPGSCHHRHFKCRARQTDSETTDTRCVRGTKVIRWLTGA